jgi:hypothetical protein
MRRNPLTTLAALGALLCVLAVSCKAPAPAPPSGIKTFALDSADGVITKDNVAFDPAVSADGKGSLKITAAAPGTVRLFEVPVTGVDNATVTYQAKVKTENFSGKAYLEMWCRLPNKGEFFSRGLASPILGNVDFTSLETPFFLKKGETPDLIKLNLVIEGTGTVWIDDIKLNQGPLK